MYVEIIPKILVIMRICHRKTALARTRGVQSERFRALSQTKFAPCANIVSIFLFYFIPTYVL